MQVDIASIQEKLACPECRSDMRCSPEAVVCGKCGARFQINDGIPLFARLGSVADHDAAVETSEQYQKAYQQEDDAADYNAMYSGRWTKRATTRRENRILDSFLSSQGRSSVILDLPCGGGRVSPSIAPHTDLLIEADIALGQVRYASKRGRVNTNQVWMTASGFNIPLKDASIDATVCIRLNHHLPLPEERERLVAELLRVSKKFVVMTFFDFYSLKNTLRRMRRPFDGKPPKCTMKVSELRDMARKYGAELVACPALFLLGSGHRYALMIKK